MEKSKKESIKPATHIVSLDEGHYVSAVETAQEKGRYVQIALSKEDIGNLLQGKAVSLLYFDEDYDVDGIIEVRMSDDKTYFKVPEWKKGTEKIMV